MELDREYVDGVAEETRGYRDLIVWQKAMDLVPMAYQLARSLPVIERYGLSSQIRRAVISVAANIAEGQGRQHPKEFLHFLSVARGSLAELDTLILAGLRLDYLQADAILPVQQQMNEVRRMLQGLMSSIKRPLRNDLSAKG